MAIENTSIITVDTEVNVPVEKAWECWTNPKHIVHWNFASEDWHSPTAENDLRVGGKFSSRMEAKDGSMGFDFGGIYDAVKINEYIEYTLGDGRIVTVTFTSEGGSTKVVESFEAEAAHSIELQKTGWQAILQNYKQYTESLP